MSIAKYQGIINNYDPKKKFKNGIYLTQGMGEPVRPPMTAREQLNRLHELNGDIKPHTYEEPEKVVAGGGAGGGGEDVIVEETKTLDDGWKQIQQQIKMNTLNSKNEVAMAQRNASKNMDNYLKALGIQGTGLGQSAYVDLATQYSNQLAGINADENTAMQSAIDAQNKEVKDMIDNGAESSVVNDYIANLKKQGFNTSSIETYQKAMGQDITTQAEQLYSTMNEEFNSNAFSGDNASYSEALTKLEQAIKSGDEKAIQEAYNFAYNVANGASGLNDNGSQEVKMTLGDLEKELQYLNSLGMVDQEMNALYSLAKSGYLNNVAIKTNDGAVIYSEGKFYRATDAQAKRAITLMEALAKYGTRR